MAANIQPVAAVIMEGLYSIPTEPVVEAASQTFTKGSILEYTISGTSSGYPEVQIAATNPDSVGIAGISCSKATGVTLALLEMVPALPNVLFEITVDDTLVNSDAPGTGTPNEFVVGKTYGVTLDPVSNNWYLDSSKNAADQVARVISYDADQATVVNGRVRIRFLLAATYL
jgi:hypothetical protein